MTPASGLAHFLQNFQQHTSVVRKTGLPRSPPLPSLTTPFFFSHSCLFPRNLVSFVTTHSGQSALASSLLSITNTPTFHPLPRAVTVEDKERDRSGHSDGVSPRSLAVSKEEYLDSGQKEADALGHFVQVGGKSPSGHAIPI